MTLRRNAAGSDLRRLLVDLVAIGHRRRPVLDLVLEVGALFLRPAAVGVRLKKAQMDEATKLARATHLRDRALELLEAKGQPRGIGGGKRIGTRNRRAFDGERMPLQALPETGKQVRCIKVLFGQKSNLPSVLDIWYRRQKVMAVEWDEDEFHLVEYSPGGWEFLMLARRVR